MTWEKFLCFLGVHDMKWAAPEQVKMSVYTLADGWKDHYPHVQMGSCSRRDCGYACRREL